jgi:hypothetical protein
MIALELSDQDIANFRLVCHSTNNAVDDDRNYFWRQRYNATYDPAGLSRPSSAMKSLYQLRRRWQRKAPAFVGGNSRDEKDFLQVIKGIIIGKIAFNYLLSSNLQSESFSLRSTSRSWRRSAFLARSGWPDFT